MAVTESPNLRRQVVAIVIIIVTAQVASVPQIVRSPDRARRRH
jgi:hypothetical protein